MLRQPREFVRKLEAKLAVAALQWRDDRTYARHFRARGAPPFRETTPHVFPAMELNSEETARRVRSADPDIIVVSGSRLVKAPLIHLAPRFGMLNIHTGLAPYYRGGPCTFWALYNEEPEYVGATVHHLSPGIDSGDIVLSAQPAIDPSDGVAALDSKVIDLGHRLLLRALGLLAEGRAPRVPQWEKGRLFLYRQLTPAARLSLEARLRQGLLARCLERMRARPMSVRTVEAV
jgi:methionyl-tRNA formyltransferase